MQAIVIRAGAFAFDFDGILFSCVADSGGVEVSVVQWRTANPIA